MNQAFLFNNGKNYMSYNMLGSRPGQSQDGEAGYRFAVWAPHAKQVCVVGDFNDWEPGLHTLQAYGSTGIWIGFIPGLDQWERYKYAIMAESGEWLLKADPYARHAETRPGTASILYNPEDYNWEDHDFMAHRVDAYQVNPLNIYEVHLGSWRRYPDGSTYNYRDIAEQLAEYVTEMGYTAVELMGIMEYPLDASWGYQVTGYFCPTSRYGTPADFKYFIDVMHKHGLRVILDWVPGHFPKDDWALARFDGQALFEYSDTRMAEQTDWGTLVFDYSKNEVRSFLFSSAYFWLDEFHLDGLRVDAVSSMIYLNFGRKDFVRNKLGGLENLEALSFLRELNRIVRDTKPECLVMAEESSAFPNVTAGLDKGGLGFTHKWNLGWMNDTLEYAGYDYIGRPYHHSKITFSMMYAFSERFILPFSHDEVVHGKKTLLGRMPGDYWRQFASLKTLYMYQMGHPGAKLNFMGNEFAPYTEWRFNEELEWFMLQYPAHSQMQTFVKDLNHLYLRERALWEVDDRWLGFEWVQVDDVDNQVFAFIRKSYDQEDLVLVVLNMTPKVFEHYSLQVPQSGQYELILNSDDSEYGGSSYWTAGQVDKVLTTCSPVQDKDEEIAPAPTSGEDEGAKDHIMIQEYEVSEELEAADREVVKQQAKPGPLLNLRLPPLCGLFIKWLGDNQEEQTEDRASLEV